MNDDELEPMDADLIALLADERARPGAPAEALAQVQRELARTIDAGGTPSPSGSRTMPRWVGPAALIAAAGAGALLHAALAPARLVYVDRPAVALSAPATVIRSPEGPSSTGAEPPASSPSALPSATTRVAPVGHVPHAPSAPPIETARDAGPAAHGDDGLRRERAMLEVARTALGRGDAASALDALARHAAEYPDGKLAEEREAMTIQSLVAAGRTDDARSRAETFRRRYPTSLLLPSIAASMGADR